MAARILAHPLDRTGLDGPSFRGWFCRRASERHRRRRTLPSVASFISPVRLPNGLAGTPHIAGLESGGKFVNPVAPFGWAATASTRDRAGVGSSNSTTPMPPKKISAKRLQLRMSDFPQGRLFSSALEFGNGPPHDNPHARPEMSVIEDPPPKSCQSANGQNATSKDRA